MGYQPHARAEGRAARGPSTRPSLSRSKLRQCPRLQRQESESLMRVTKTRILVADPSRKDRNPPPCIVDRSVKVTPLSGTRTHRRPARLNRAPTLYGACSVAVAGHALRWAAQRSCQNRASSAAVGFAAGAACQLRLLCGLASAGFAVYAFLSSQAAAHNTKPGSPRRAAFGLQGWPSRRVASRASATLSGSAASARPTLSPAAEPAWRAAHGRARRGGLHGRPGHVPSSGPRSHDDGTIPSSPAAPGALTPAPHLAAAALAVATIVGHPLRRRGDSEVASTLAKLVGRARQPGGLRSGQHVGVRPACRAGAATWARLCRRLVGVIAAPHGTRSGRTLAGGYGLRSGGEPAGGRSTRGRREAPAGRLSTREA